MRTVRVTKERLYWEKRKNTKNQRTKKLDKIDR
jgi:hypothetical protein